MSTQTETVASEQSNMVESAILDDIQEEAIAQSDACQCSNYENCAYENR